MRIAHEALTFDDVLLQPKASDIIPAQAKLQTRLTRGITMNVPLLSAAMDTVTEAKLAIAMAQIGGIGVIHRNLSIEEQAEEVRRVKRYESGMVVNPVTIGPDATRGELAVLGERYNFSGLPVTEENGKLVGIITDTDFVAVAINLLEQLEETEPVDEDYDDLERDFGQAFEKAMTGEAAGI